MKIAVHINGEEERLQQCTIEALVAARKLVAASLVIEHNGRIIKQPDWCTVTIKQGDTLELLQFVGGG